ncbi:MAG TPA: AAA family ATPase, partial [Blastocatellia bacterium]|nr:AAA family ATPase [Blastocatellia bacterium]
MRGGEKQLYEFGPFRLDVSERLLVRDGAVVPVTSRVFDLLLLLIRNRGRALSKEELMSKLWPDTAVEYNNLTVNMSALRKALGDNSSSPLYIETVPRRGYRFVASLKEFGDESYSSEAPAVHTNTSGWPALEEPAATFVGREQELERLDELLDKAVEGQGRVIFITGETGIGKTSLAGRFVRRARASHPELIFSIGRCLEQYGTGEAYLPFLEALGALLLSPEREPVASLLRTFAPTWCLQFPAAFAPDTLERLERETIGATKERMLREMGDALSQLARVSPVVMLIEDLHWADPSSTDLLRLLGARIERQRLLVVGTFRPEEVELGDHPLKNLRRELRAHNKCEEITLRLLDEQHIADYLDARFSPNDFPRELAGLVQRKTEGHPLFATSLIEFLAERGDIARAGDRWALTRPIPEMGFEIPEGVRGMIRKKIESLDEQDRLALRYASVEGEEFTSTVLAALLGADELALEERLGRLINVHRLIEIKGEEELPDGHLATRYRFIHVLYQNLLYEDLVSKRRIALHREA